MRPVTGCMPCAAVSDIRGDGRTYPICITKKLSPSILAALRALNLERGCYAHDVHGSEYKKKAKEMGNSL